MELVRIPHRDARERVKVLLENGIGDALHPLRDNVRDAVLEERRGLDGALHAAG